jgi:uncharacterized protein (DUF427 family)
MYLHATGTVPDIDRLAETPYPAVAAIKDHLAFYPARVGAIEQRP